MLSQHSFDLSIHSPSFAVQLIHMLRLPQQQKNIQLALHFRLIFYQIINYY